MGDERLRPEYFFDLSTFEHKEIFQGVKYVWEVLPRIGDYARDYVNKRMREVNPKVEISLPPNTVIEGEVHIEKGAVIDPLCIIRGKVHIEKGVYIKAGTVIEGEVCIKKNSKIGPNAVILGANVIGELCEIRPGAFFRGNVIMGVHSVFRGEAKNTIFLDALKTPEGVLAETAAAHFAYIGDSILGRTVNLGAGTKISNVKVNWEEIVIVLDGQRYETGLQKFGAIIGDQVSTGCNSVLNPGTMIGKRCKTYPNVTLRGYYPPDTIIKLRQKVETAVREERGRPTIDGRL